MHGKEVFLNASKKGLHIKLVLFRRNAAIRVSSQSTSISIRRKTSSHIWICGWYFQRCTVSLLIYTFSQVSWEKCTCTAGIKSTQMAKQGSWMWLPYATEKHTTAPSEHRCWQGLLSRISLKWLMCWCKKQISYIHIKWYQVHIFSHVLHIADISCNETGKWEIGFAPNLTHIATDKLQTAQVAQLRQFKQVMHSSNIMFHHVV